MSKFCSCNIIFMLSSNCIMLAMHGQHLVAASDDIESVTGNGSLRGIRSEDKREKTRAEAAVLLVLHGKRGLTKECLRLLFHHRRCFGCACPFSSCPLNQFFALFQFRCTSYGDGCITSKDLSDHYSLGGYINPGPCCGGSVTEQPKSTAVRPVEGTGFVTTEDQV